MLLTIHSIGHHVMETQMELERTNHAQLVALDAKSTPHAPHVQLDIIYLLVFALPVRQIVVCVPVLQLVPLALEVTYIMDTVIILAQLEPMQVEETVLPVHQVAILVPVMHIVHLARVLTCIMDAAIIHAQPVPIQVEETVTHAQCIVLPARVFLCVVFAAQATIYLWVLAIWAVLLEHTSQAQFVQDHGQTD